jgi:hypothetical protein
VSSSRILQHLSRVLHDTVLVALLQLRVQAVHNGAMAMLSPHGFQVLAQVMMDLLFWQQPTAQTQWMRL